MLRVAVILILLAVVVAQVRKTAEALNPDRLRNPGSETDLFCGLPVGLYFKVQKKSPDQQGSDGLRAISSWVSQQLWVKTSQTQLVSGTQLALWFGDLRGLPFWLIDKYRDSGLLAVLAISGQHVWGIVFCLSWVGALFLWGYKVSNGFFLAKIRDFKLLAGAGILFILASEEASMVRTLLCVSCLWGLRKLPVQFDSVNASLYVILITLCFFPFWGAHPGFILSAIGFLGVVMSKKIFSGLNGKKQIVLVWVWTCLSLSPLVLFYFGQLNGFYLFFQAGMGWIWDQIFLPLFFVGGFLLILLPTSVAVQLSGVFEKPLAVWADWEAVRADITPYFGYRPLVGEILLFWAWLIALGFFVQNMRLIDFTRRARRQ